MTITARGSSWLVSVGSGKDRERVTCKTPGEATRVEAELIESQAQAKVKSLLAAQRGDSSKTLQDAYDRAYRESWAGSKGERTTTLNAKDMVDLIGPDTPVTEIDSDAIDEALDKLSDRGLTGATINRKIAVLNVMLKTAEEKGWLNRVPRVKRRAESKGRIFFYTWEEEQSMIAACQYLGLVDLEDYIPFAISTGFRRSEMLRLAVHDCDAGQLILPDTKNGERRALPQTTSTAPVVQKARDRGHARVFQNMTNSTLRAQWDAMCDYLGTENNPKYIVHVLRHTTATRLAIGGATAAQIMTFMGHKAIQTSIRYIHMTTDHLKGVAAILERPVMPRPTLRVVNGGVV